MRPPDLAIYGPSGQPQTLRWVLWRGRGRFDGWQLTLHRWLLSDDERALHDHRGDNVSLLLTGCYREVLSHAWETRRARVRLPFIPYFRRAETPHRVEIMAGPLWSLWLRTNRRPIWGFWCRSGWRTSAEYLKTKDYYSAGASVAGRGCD